MDIKQVNSAIMFGDFTDIELNSILDAIKFKRACMAKAISHKINEGSKVVWYSSKRGMHANGTVTKVAKKYATVQCGRTGAMWKVPMSMLEVA